MRERLVRGLNLMRKQTETIAAANQTIISLERQLGQWEEIDRGRLALIRALFDLLDAHGIDHPPLPLKAEMMH